MFHSTWSGSESTRDSAVIYLLAGRPLTHERRALQRALALRAEIKYECMLTQAIARFSQQAPL